MALFAVAALSPLGLGIGWGGLWAAGALAYMTALAAALDQMRLAFADAEDGAEFPAADALLVAVGVGAVLALPVTVWAVAGGSGLSPLARGAVFLGAGLWLGQVAHPAAHELIHRGNRWLFGLGVAVYGLLGFGHHASAHRLVHHRHVATAHDPNSARAGEGFYRFFLRAWGGSFLAGWQAERALRGRTPYAAYLGLAVGGLALGWAMAGWQGALVWAALGLHVQVQILLSDYVQHYGLVRAEGRGVPVTIAHSWNAPHWFSGAFMLNAPRHSDHHAHPSRPYPALRLPDKAPMLPWPLPLACTIALVPPLWRRRIAPHLAQWRRE
jgi:alkane 1-monooxygenase